MFNVSFDKLVEPTDNNSEEYYEDNNGNRYSYDEKEERIEELEEKISLLQNSEKIYSAVEGTYELLNNSDNGLISALGTAMSSLQSISGYSKELNSISEDFSDLFYRLDDISGNLRDIKDKVTLYDHLCLCTDDEEADDILKHGQMSRVVNKAIECGLEPIVAIKSATYNIAKEINTAIQVFTVLLPTLINSKRRKHSP